MGYKFFDTIIQFDNTKPLKSDSTHSKQKAMEFLNFINKGAQPISSKESGTYQYNSEGTTNVGAYDEGLIISNFNLCNSLIFKDKVAKKILSRYPNSKITSVFVLENSNSVGFTQYINGEQIRAFCCDAEDITFDKGAGELDSDITVDEDGEQLEEWNVGLISALNYYDDSFTKEVAQEELHETWIKSQFLWSYPGFLKRLFM